MNNLKKNCYHWKVCCLIVLFIVLIIFVKTEITSSRYYNKIQNEINNEYVPVKLESPPVGYIYQDIDGRIKSRSVFHIQNHSDQEQSITFLLYQPNYKTKQEDQLFDLEYVYIWLDVETDIEVETGIIKIPGGETMMISVNGIARDPSKVITTRSSPEIEVVKMD